MLKPLSDYKQCEVQISSRPVTISASNYSNAIIFFTPKIAEKNIDINQLTCEFVQIIDRGDWGKEEVNHSLSASSFSNRKYQEFYLETNCNSSELKFLPPKGLKLGIIEVYFDLEITNNNLNYPNMSNFNNPSSGVDFTPLLAALQSSTDAQVAATNQAAAIANPTITKLEESTYSATVWSNVPANHVVLQPDPKRVSGRIYNDGNKPVAVDRFIDIATKTSAAQYDGFIAPGGIYTLEELDAKQGVLLYTLAGNGSQSCRINLDKLN